MATPTVLTVPVPDSPYTHLQGSILNIAGNPPTTTISISCPSATESDAILSCALQPSNSLLVSLAESTYAAHYTLARRNGDITATEMCAASASTPTACTTEFRIGARSTRIKNPGGFILAPVTVTAGPTSQPDSAAAGETGTAASQTGVKNAAGRLSSASWALSVIVAASIISHLSLAS